MFLQNSNFFSTSFWQNYEQCLSMYILKISSLSVSTMKWRTFAMLPKQQFQWGVLMATEIGKLWQNSNTLTLLFECQMYWICFVDDLVFRGKCLCRFWLDALFYSHQSLCKIKWAFVNISISLLFLILSLASGS